MAALTQPSEERAAVELNALVAILDPLLVPHGFSFAPGDRGFSSGGGFANGFYRHPKVQIGLIYRGAELGGPSYASGRVPVAHHQLMRELGHADDCALWFDDAIDVWRVTTRRGLTPVDALVADLTDIVVPCVSLAPESLEAALARGVAKRLAELRRR